MKKTTLKDYSCITVSSVERISKKAIIKIIMYLKSRKKNVSAFKQIHGKKWIITYERNTTTFLNNKYAYEYLNSIFQLELKKEYSEYLAKRRKRDELLNQISSPVRTQESTSTALECLEP